MEKGVGVSKAGRRPEGLGVKGPDLTPKATRSFLEDSALPDNHSGWTHCKRLQ